MDIINILILSVRGPPLGARIWRLQTARAERVKQSKATFGFQLFLRHDASYFNQIVYVTVEEYRIINNMDQLGKNEIVNILKVDVLFFQRHQRYSATHCVIPLSCI